jgi:hypothetical protein
MTMMAVRGDLEVGRVVRITLEVIRHNFLSFLALSLIFSGLPSIAAAWAKWRFIPMQELGTSEAQFFTLLAGVGGLITGAIAQGAIVHITARHLEGLKAPIGDSLATGLRNFFPLIGLNILSGLMVGLATILLIFPGIMVATRWAVAVPALVLDRTTISSAFSRSRDLTEGQRLRIFGLFVVFLFGLLLVAVVVGAAVGLLFSAPDRMGDLISDPLSAVLSGLIGTPGTAVLYIELRRLREGAGPSDLAKVFD